MRKLIEGIDVESLYKPKDITGIVPLESVHLGEGAVVFDSGEAYKKHELFKHTGAWLARARPKIYIKEFEDMDLGVRVFSEVAYGGIAVEIYNEKDELVMCPTGVNEVVLETICVVNNGYYMGKDGLSVFIKAGFE